MSGNAEYGICDICKTETHLERTYFRYSIKCECHSPYHFEIVYHCNKCTPIEPKFTRINLSTEYLKKITKISERIDKLKKLNNID